MRTDRAISKEQFVLQMLREKLEMSTSEIRNAARLSTMHSAKQMMTMLKKRGIVYNSHLNEQRMTVWKLCEFAKHKIPDADLSKIPEMEGNKVNLYKSEIARVKKDGRISLLVIDGVKVWSKADGVLI